MFVAALAAFVLSVQPANPQVGVPVVVQLQTQRPLARAPSIVAISPVGDPFRLRVVRTRNRRAWRGHFTFEIGGNWELRARRARVRVAVAGFTPPPPGFGPLGAADCAPPSPRSENEIFGTAFGAQFWALVFAPPSSWATSDTAVFDGVLGKEIKIVFKLTGGAPSEFFAVAPDGRRTQPVWGPTIHSSSSWKRPGDEWGAGFVFSQPGCWRIHASSLGSGDIWFIARS
jgi:hypothetical protein